MQDADELKPGFMIIHSNRLDDLRALAVNWMQRYPLAPLENEVVLVHSNGISQWPWPMTLKQAVAALQLRWMCSCRHVFCGKPIDQCWVRTQHLKPRHWTRLP